eukprot:TRINITY_DN79_c3_g4_i1.p1 TRINITY_DN79_c3_g4~~TRINITY_DN79_c3_g4_i1.p1  ORF type:complete len:307 (+),score=152.00 TRINITY_DN79_c3_g4_i1:56-976(+)
MASQEIHNNENENENRPIPLPYFNFGILNRVDWRNNDIVVSSGAKCGTTWTLQMVFQLLNKGSTDYKDLLLEQPWPEFVEYPGQPETELLERWSSIPITKRRAFKTHAGPPVLPILPHVKYVVTARNPKDAATSLFHFMKVHSKEFLEMWNLTFPDLPPNIYMEEFFFKVSRFFEFYSGWWNLRSHPNVLILHFDDLKKNMNENLITLANFLEIEPISEDCWQKIREHCSIDWMRTNGEKFELTFAGKQNNIHVINPGGMIRKGVSNDHVNFFTPEMNQRFQQVFEQKVPDPKLRHWLEFGGNFEK